MRRKRDSGNPYKNLNSEKNENNETKKRNQIQNMKPSASYYMFCGCDSGGGNVLGFEEDDMKMKPTLEVHGLSYVGFGNLPYFGL